MTKINKDDHFRVPEERSHMILPEIEEEEELPEEKKLSLTSLLLGRMDKFNLPRFLLTFSVFIINR